MNPAAQTALWQYVESGGALLVLGKAKVADSWRQEDLPALRCKVSSPGFGQCIVADEPDCRRWDNGLWLFVTRPWSATSAPYQRSYGPLEANKYFPVVDDLGIPARGLFVLMLCFAIVLGPVNIYLLTKWKRRLWMLWTVPVISATTCAAVLVYMVLAEGWSGHLRTEAITVLDQSGQRAATIGWTAFYSPLTPGDGLHFGPETELTAQGGDDDFYFDRRGYTYEEDRRGAGKVCTLDWSIDQHLARGWVSARLPAHFRLRKSEVQRERVTVHRDREGNLSAVNGLGAEITTLWLADEKGRLYMGGPLAPGARERLTLSDRTLRPQGVDRIPLREIYRGEWLAAAKTLRAAPERTLTPLSYLADVAGAPFVEDGLRKAGDRKVHSLVVGLLKEIEP
jgi:hypothetical protein